MRGNNWYVRQKVIAKLCGGNTWVNHVHFRSLQFHQGCKTGSASLWVTGGRAALVIYVTGRWLFPFNVVLTRTAEIMT